MIQRKQSKIIDSVVNAAHEEHFNIAKAIRDDAPITAMNSVVKSINFESDDDGAYILRKPLVKKHDSSDNEFFLYDHEHVINIENDTLTISGASKIVLRFYDYKTLNKHDIEQENASLDISWLNIHKHFNSSDATILSTTVDHQAFLDLFSEIIRYATTSQVGRMNPIITYHYYWKYSLDNITEVSIGGNMSPDMDYIKPRFKMLTSLKRFVKIYEDVDEEGTFIVEVVHPELNTFTSALDTKNTEALPVNLLLENPYAVRDLYDYGYVGTTKILAYIPIEEMSLADIRNCPIWQLTETAFVNENEEKTVPDKFRLLSSANPKTFNYGTYIILKAFLTSAISEDKAYFCCWERSKDNGATWEECPDFLEAHANALTEILVSDTSSAEFDNLVYDEKLDKAKSYLVKKKVACCNFGARHNIHKPLPNSIAYDSVYDASDTISYRPDVLIIEYPDMSYHYRFQIYLRVDKPMVDPGQTTATKELVGLHATSGDIVTGKIEYTTVTNGGLSAPTIIDDALVLYPANNTYIGTGTEESPKRIPIGNSLTLKVTDEAVKILYVTFTYKYVSPYSGSATDKTFGAAIGAINRVSQEDLPAAEDDNNPYGMTRIDVVDGRPTPGHPGGLIPYVYYDYNCNNLMVDFKPSVIGTPKTQSYYASTFDNNNDINTFSLVNLTGCMSDNERLSSRGVGDSYLSGDQEDVNNIINNYKLIISRISVTYSSQNEQTTTNIFLVSTTGAYQIPYTDVSTLAVDLSKDRNRLFDGNMYYNDNQMQLITYKNNFIYSSNTNSSIVRLMNGINIPEEVTKIVPWRGYLLIFSPRNIYLASYDSSFDGYNLKVLSNTVGVPKEDADTVVPILNSVYFKSNAKIYKLVPNLYAAADNILNVHQVSTGINHILEDIVNNNIETHNFSYSDADTYTLFIPIQYTNKTYCIIYDFNRQIWTLLEFPTYLLGLERFSTTEVYVKDSSAIYYFRETLSRLLALGLDEWCEENDDSPNNYDLQMFINAVPYADYLTTKPKELIPLVIENATTNHSHEETFGSIRTPISFQIDFGQKSSNYTMDKQFLETKFTLATLSIKDSFPIVIDIYTDGISRELHWDSNTDGALWKNSLDDVGVLNTSFAIKGQDYNGIFRQLIVKYSGKGKSIRHVISGTSKALFKFYSMDVRGRILPKKH
jgi:hypothetical protein